MPPAQKKFFSLPELVYQLMRYLNKQHILKLMHINRFTHACCLPFLYYFLELSSSAYTVHPLTSETALSALSRNAHYIQYLTLGRAELAVLYNCILVHFAPSVLEKGIIPHAAMLPTYLPPPDTCLLTTVPFRPMTNLTFLTIQLQYNGTLFHRLRNMPSMENKRMTIAQACWIISLSPHLVTLKVHYLTIKEQREVRLLGDVIFELGHLQSLELKLLVRGEWYTKGSWYHAGSTLMFSCPSSIRRLQIDLIDYESTDTDSDSTDMEYEEQYKHQDYSDDEYMDDNIGHENEMSTYLNMTDMDGQIYSDLEEEEAQAMKFNAGDKSSKRAWSLDRWAKGQCTDDELMSRSDRSEPRMELVDVGLWNFANSTTQDQLVWLYEHCCMVEKLNISSFQTEVNPKVIANIIKTLCTKIRTLTFRRSELGYWSGTLPFEVLCAMPKQQLITIDYRKVEYRLTEEMTQISILRHSDTLTTLILQECDQISSKAIQVILKVCTGLIHLQLGWDEDEVPSYIHLEDAISTSWASNKFTYLELTIAIPKLRYESTQIPYYRRHPKCILTPSETHLFSQLQTLYYQLASLRDLTQLDLRALESGADDISVIDPFYFEHTFPAMFSLGDTRSGRPGFLTLFEGWTRLKEIRGSFSICTNETFETMNTLEASWIATHWPALKFIEFHQGDEEEEREVFRWLEDYRQLYDPAFSIGLGY